MALRGINALTVGVSLTVTSSGTWLMCSSEVLTTKKKKNSPMWKCDATNYKVVDTIQYDSDWAATVVQKIILSCVCFLHHNFKNGSLHSITGDEMVRRSFFFFLSLTLTCCESRISYGLNGHYHCRPVHCSQKLWPGGNYRVTQKTLSLWTWWAWIVPASLVVWILWQV